MIGLLLFITFFYIHSCNNESCNEISLCTDCLKNTCLFCSGYCIEFIFINDILINCLDNGKCIEINERENCRKPVSQTCVCSLFLNCSICAPQYNKCKWYHNLYIHILFFFRKIGALLIINV
jgi:hypothetical protein